MLPPKRKTNMLEKVKRLVTPNLVDTEERRKRFSNGAPVCSRKRAGGKISERFVGHLIVT
jgi:hypothetical protein